MCSMRLCSRSMPIFLVFSLLLLVPLFDALRADVSLGESGNQVPATELFSDNFEAGDFSAWAIVFPTSMSGTLLDANSAAVGQTVPIVGATVSIVGTELATQSDSEGKFLLTGIPKGYPILDIDTSTAKPAPDKSAYASFRESLLITPGHNAISRPFYLPRIDSRYQVAVNPDATTIVENPDIGVKLEIPPGAAKNPDGSLFKGEISVSEVPRGFAPVALPAEFDPGILVTIQPIGLRFDPPLPITFPNLDEIPPGVDIDILSADPDSGTFMAVAKARATANGIESFAGGVRVSSWHAPPPVPIYDVDFLPEDNDDNEDEGKDCKESTGSSTTVCSGSLVVEHSTPSYRSLEEERSIRLVYHSKRVSPQPSFRFAAGTIVRRIIGWRPATTVDRFVAAPVRLSVRLDFNGMQQDVYLSAFSSPSGKPVFRAIVPGDATELPTGLYPYSLAMRSNFASSNTAGFRLGEVPIVNLTDSPFGAGWGLDGLDRLHLSETGSALLVEGDGSVRLYRAIPASKEKGLRLQVYETMDPLGAIEARFEGLEPVPFTAASQSGGIQQLDSVVVPNVNIERQQSDSSFLRLIGSRVGLESGVDQVSPQGLPDGDDVLVEPPSGIETTAVKMEGYLYLPKSGEISIGGVCEDYCRVELDGRLIFLNMFSGQRAETRMLRVQSGLKRISVLYAAQSSAPFFQLTVSGAGFPGGAIPDEYLYPDVPAAAQFEYRSPQGDFSRLIGNGDGTFTRRMKDGLEYRFSHDGLLRSVVDRNVNTMAYGYDDAGRLISLTDPVGLVTIFRYKDGLLDEIEDPQNRVTQFSYDSQRNLVEITDPDLTVRQFLYNGAHRMTSQISKRGYSTGYEYNFAGQHSRAVWADGSERRVVPYASVGMADMAAGQGTITSPLPVLDPAVAMGQLVDGDGNVTRIKTDRYGAVTLRKDPLGRNVSIVRDLAGQPSSIDWPRRTTKNFRYDEQGNLLTYWYYDKLRGQTYIQRSFSYEKEFNQVAGVVDAYGTTEISYDSRGNAIAVRDGAGFVTSLVVNSRGQVVRVVDPNGNATEQEYDEKGNLRILRDALGNEAVLERDAAGHLVRQVDPNGHATVTSRDVMNRAISVTDANGAVTCFFYDEDGSLSRLLDANGNETTYAYDSVGRVASMTDPLGKLRKYEYSPGGDLTGIVTRNGQRIEFRYNAVRQVVEKILPNDDVTTFSYDDDGNALEVRNSDVDLLYRYYGRDLVEAENRNGLDMISYKYNLAGERTVAESNSLFKMTYGYDARGLLTEIHRESRTVNLFSYDPAGRLVEHRAKLEGSLDPLIGYSVYSYDQADRVTRIMSFNSSESVISDLGYSYDPSGYRTSASVSRVDIPANPVQTFAYDPTNQVTRASRPLLGEPDEVFGYDLVGNRISRDGAPGPYQIGAGNRLLNDGVFTYSYDNEGNLNRRRNIATGSETAYSWNAENRLTRIDLPDGGFVALKYDGVGRLYRKILNGVETTYSYDGSQVILAITQDTGIIRFISDPRFPDAPLLVAGDANAGYGHGSGSIYFVVRDALGSVLQFVNASDLLLQSQAYDSFGGVRVFNSSGVEIPAEQALLLSLIYSYTGREFNSSSGNYNYRLRFYAPGSGRFLSEDPIRHKSGDSNLYRYVFNNSVNFSDPLGAGPGVELACEVAVLLATNWGLPEFVEQASELRDCLEAELERAESDEDLVNFLENRRRKIANFINGKGVEEAKSSGKFGSSGYGLPLSAFCKLLGRLTFYYF